MFFSKPNELEVLTNILNEKPNELEEFISRTQTVESYRI